MTSETEQEVVPNNTQEDIQSDVPAVIANSGLSVSDVSRLKNTIQSVSFLKCNACDKSGMCEWEGKYVDAYGVKRCQLEVINTNQLKSQIESEYITTDFMNLEQIMAQDDLVMTTLIKERAKSDLHDRGLVVDVLKFNNQGEAYTEKQVNRAVDVFQKMSYLSKQNMEQLKKLKKEMDDSLEKERKKKTQRIVHKEDQNGNVSVQFDDDLDIIDAIMDTE